MRSSEDQDRRIAEKSGQPRVAPFSAQNGFTNPFDRSYRTHPIAVRIKREPVIRQITRHRYERVTHDRAERGEVAAHFALQCHWLALQGNFMLCYFFTSARKLGVVIIPICACLETIVAVPGEPEAP